MNDKKLVYSAPHRLTEDSTLKYDIYRGEFTYVYLDMPSDVEQLALVTNRKVIGNSVLHFLDLYGFWIKITEVKHEDEEVTYMISKEIGPLSTRMGRVKTLCDKMSKQRIHPQQAEDFVIQYINGDSASSKLCWEEDLHSMAHKRVHGEEPKFNSRILNHKQNNDVD